MGISHGGDPRLGSGVSLPVTTGTATPAATPETAGADLLIERVDLGPGCHTLITAGETIPAALAKLPRRPRGRARAPARKRRR